MKAAITFKAENRTKTGKGASRQLRREGKLPAVLYGKDQQPLSFAIDHNAFMTFYLKGGVNNKVVDIQLDGKTHHVLPREIQLHPVSDVPEHIDFLTVDENSRVNVLVPVHVLNTDRCVGVKRGGRLNIVRHEIELVCVPDSIPPVIKIDVTELKISESVHISHIELPKGVVPAITDRDFTIITITGRGGKGDGEEETAEGEESAA